VGNLHRGRLRRHGLHCGTVRQLAERRHGVGEPDVAADDAVVPHYRLAAKYGRTGVDDHPIFDGWVALTGRVTLAYAQASERDSLIERDVVADNRRLADDDPGAVVDAEP